MNTAFAYVFGDKGARVEAPQQIQKMQRSRRSRIKRIIEWRTKIFFLRLRRGGLGFVYRFFFF